MISIRTGLAVLLSVAMCLAQTASDHHVKKTRAADQRDAFYLDQALASTDHHAQNAPPVTSRTVSGNTVINWNDVPTQGSMMVATGLGWTQGANGIVYYMNDMTTGIETRPLDNKGPKVTEVDYSAARLNQAELAPASYIALAKQVKLDSPALDEAHMLQTIYDHHFRVYDFDKVDNYLYRQALKQGARMRWVWKPMREGDFKALQAAGSPSQKTGIVLAKLYGQRIPARILEDAKCVLADVPDAVLLISDFEAVKPDPFLAITTPKLLAEGKLWIVDRWDEPGFEDRGTTVGKPGGGEPAKDVVKNSGGEAALVAAIH